MAIQDAQQAIVVGVDNSPASALAVGWAARDAQLRRVPLRLVNVVAPLSITSSSPWAGVPAHADYARFKADRTGARRILEIARKTAVRALSPDREAPPIITEVLIGALVPTLTDYAERAAMLVVGCHSRTAIPRALFGSVSGALDHHVHCPLGVVHDDDPVSTLCPEAPVVVGVDGSPASESALQIGFEEASRRKVDLIAVHTWSDDGPVSFGRPAHAPVEWANFQAQEEEVLAERLAGFASRYPDVTVHRIVAADRPVPRLLNLAKDAQLLVVGCHDRGRFVRALRGSVSSSVINEAHIPVIVAHHRAVHAA